ncbi:hypothetical protein GIB67_004988 [Kingdonia uniflora]|uniref:Uncharacterized protein n=1 Tax=Kingdonia uniflora TaxID=39325 RepID=A0A7J7NMR6_9MAGN|nr:hypothetical protein GIB67_004988 [Kingdonia uniflora]
MSAGRSGKDMEIGRKNMLKNEESCDDGNVDLSKRYKASDVESGKDASVLESRTREKRKIRGFDKELSEGDKRLKRAKDSGSRRWVYDSVMWERLDATANSHSDTEVFKMGSSSVNEVSTSGRRNESDNEGEVGLEQFQGFPGQLISYPPCSDTFREFCKAKATVRGKWVNCAEFTGIDESISLDYFDGDVWSDLLEGFLCYLFQLEYGLSLPLTNLAKGIMNAIGACLVQLNGNMWEVITMCDHLNEKWEMEGKVRRITPEDVLQFYGVKNYKASGGSYFCASVTRHRFFNLNLAGQTWNENIIWVKVDSKNVVIASVKSKVERKESLLDKVAEEEIELKLVLEGLGLSRKKRVNSSLTQPNPVRPSKIALKYLKKQMLKALSASGTIGSVDDLKEVEERARLAVLHRVKDTNKMVEVDTFKVDTYSEEKDEEEEEVVRIVDGLDGVSRQTVLDNQGDDIELLEGGNEKVELDSSRSREDDVLMCNWEYAEQLDKMMEGNENREDHYVKAHFKPVEETQAVSDLTLQVEEKDALINKGLKELAEVTERAEKLQRRVDALAVKGKQADTAQYRVQAIEQSEHGDSPVKPFPKIYNTDYCPPSIW